MVIMVITINNITLISSIITTTIKDLTRDWNQIRSTATDVLEEAGVVTTNRKRVPLKGFYPFFFVIIIATMSSRDILFCL